MQKNRTRLVVVLGLVLALGSVLVLYQFVGPGRRAGSAPPARGLTESLEPSGRQVTEPSTAKTQSTESPMPEFPWPPPTASAWDVIPNDLIIGHARAEVSFSMVEDRLGRALDTAGYHQRSFFTVPGGFAIVTQLERVGADGIAASDHRWQMADASATFSLESYLRRLLFAEPGNFRLVVLVVSDVPFSPNGGFMTASDASRLVGQGVNALPGAVLQRPYSQSYRCTALIYQFQKGAAKPELLVPSPLPGRDHLVRARIWAALSGPNQQR
jgi:hypothetical protein